MFIPPAQPIQTKSITFHTNTYFTKQQVKLAIYFLQHMPTDPANPNQEFEMETEIANFRKLQK